MDYIAQPKDYWIATNAINITRNALGKPNRIQCSVVSGAAILCYIEGVDGLGYDNGHRFRTWPLTISPTYFNSNTEKYVYVAIPRSAAVGTRAVVVFPSEQLDIYGVNANDEQVGSTDYYYIWLQGIITATDGTSNREWQQTIDFGKKGTDEDLYDTSSEWFQYSKVNEVVTFLKNIAMKAGTTFQNLILGNKELTGVATSNTAYTDSDALVATPGYVESQYLSKTHESTAQEQVSFMKGLWVKAKNLFGIDAAGNATLNSVKSDDIHSDGYNDDNIGGEGYHVYKDANGQGHVCTDFLDVRLKARFTEVEIRRLSYVNADQVQSMAASKVEKVLPIGADGNVLTGSYSSSAIIAYRCLAVADDGSTATKNGWKLGDQARCQTFNITAPGNYTDVTNRLYWRLVVRIGQCSADGVILDTESSSSSDSSDEGDSKVYHFFDLANIADIAANDGAEFNEFFADPLTTGDAYHGYATQWTETTGSSIPVTVNSGNDAPAADDAVVQMGSQTDETRMGFFITKADGLNTGPYIYAGVNNFSLAGKMITKISPAEVLISARKLRVFVDPTAGSYEPLVIYRGDWEPGSTSYYYDEWDYNGSRWLCLYQGAEGTTEAPGTTPANWKEISLKGDSVKIAGYAEYYYGDSSRPKPASPSVDGDIALLDYPDNSDDMIDVGVIEDMETLSGYWDGQSVPYGTCYIYRPNKHLYEATESGWRDLGKFVGDDGNGILSITRTYGISAQSTTASETTAPSDISSWASNSPAVTEAKPFLWAKEVVVYTKASTTTKYYCIGARGANGVDAQDIEWAYIRTKTNVAPVISNDSTYTDSNGKAFTDDDHLPKVVAGSGGSLSDIEDDNSGNPAKKYECTDDPQGVTSEWKYEWEIKREKGNADSSGHRAWSAYSGEMTIHTMWAASPIIADLDNEMDSVACNTQGHPVQISGSNQVVSTNVSLMNGSTSVTPSSIVVRDTNSSGTQYGSGQTAQNGIKVTITGQKIDVEFTTSATIDGKKVFYIALTGTVNGASVTRELYFTVNGVRPGADGEPATLYNIIPSPNDIAFSRLASGGLNPDKQYLTFTVKKTVGDDITELLSGQMYNSDKLKLKYSTSAPPSSDYSDGTEWGSVEQGSKISFSYGTATIPNDVAFSCLYLALFKEVTENGNASYVLHDRETILIVRDGAKGTDGKDGKDGIDGTDGKDGSDGKDGNDGYTISLTPSTIIINQSEELDGNGQYPLIYTNAFGLLRVMKSGVGVDASVSVSLDGHTTVSKKWSKNSVSGWEKDNSLSTGEFKIAITAVSTNGTFTDKTVTPNVTRNKYYDSGRITITVTPTGATNATTLYLDYKCNLMGQISTTIKGDVEETVANKEYSVVDEDGNVVTTQTVGQYIRSSSQNTARLTETVGNLSTSNGNNLFGFSKGAIFDGSVPFVQGYGMACVWNNGQAYSRVWNLDFGGKSGYYVVTCEIKAQSEANIRFFLADIPPVDGVGLTNVGNELKVAVTTQWKKITAVYNLTAVDAANSNGQLVIRDGSTSNNVFIRYLQIERGSVPSAFGICKEDGICASEAMPLSITAKEEISYKSGSSIGNLEGLPFYEQQYSWNDDDQNWIDAGGGNPYIDLLRNSVKLNLSVGVYTLSFWAKASDDGMSFRSHLYDPAIIAGISGVLETSDDTSQGIYADGATEVYLTTTWRKYYIHWYVTSAGSRSLIIARLQKQTFRGDNNDNLNGYVYLCGIRFDKGYVTSANRTVYSTVMKQTARTIDFSVLVNSMEKAGIHMYTESNGTPENEAELAKGIIDLAAGKVNFVDPNGDPYQNPKVSIDPSTGALYAVDGIFNGELTAGDMKVTRRQESDHVWSGMYTPSLSEAVSIGVRNYSNGNSYSGEILLLGSGVAGGYVYTYAGGNQTGSRFELSYARPTGSNRSRIVLASGNESGKASITVQTTVESGASASATVIEQDKVTTPTVETTTARATDVYASNIRASAGYRIPTTDPSLKTISSTTTISDSACQMIIVTGYSDVTVTLTSTPETGKLMIIKKTTESGWVTVKNSGGTQIGKFNCGSLVCVYNSGWQ